MRLNMLHKPRGAKQWALLTVTLVLLLFFCASCFVWQNELLGDVAFVALLTLMRAHIVLGRRAAGAGGKGPATYSEVAEEFVRMEKKVGVGLVLLGLILFAAVSLSWSTRILGLAVVMIGILFMSDSFNRFMRIVGFALVPLNVFFIGALYLDAVHGHDKVWPVYTFVACGLVSGLVWSYLLGRALFRWPLR